MGQGLAGTALAWELERRGEDFLIIDEDKPSTASLVAAGLVTPVTGKRFTVSEHFNELSDKALRFYRSIEAQLSEHFYYEQPALRLVYGRDERVEFDNRTDGLLNRGHIRLCSNSNSTFRGEPAAFVMPNAARLMTSSYLHSSKNYFKRQGKHLVGRVETSRVEVIDQRVSVGVALPTAKQVVFCGGYQDESNPWLPHELFNRAKGEMITVRLELEEHRTVHAHSSWLCPTDVDSVYLFGSTYDHGQFDHHITDGARSELVQRLSQFVPGAIEVIEQHFGVRPIGMQRKAIVGRHPTEPRIAWLNGLGSKGALLSPYLAAVLARALFGDGPVEAPLIDAHISNAH